MVFGTLVPDPLPHFPVGGEGYDILEYAQEAVGNRAGHFIDEEGNHVEVGIEPDKAVHVGASSHHVYEVPAVLEQAGWSHQLCLV